jgi:hypothetical protein
MLRMLIGALCAAIAVGCSADVKVDENADTTRLAVDTAIAPAADTAVANPSDAPATASDTEATAPDATPTAASTPTPTARPTASTAASGTSPGTTPAATPSASTPKSEQPKATPPPEPPASTPPASTPPATQPEPTASTGSDGKAIFLANKCNGCHGIASQGIVKDVRDLSSVGTKHDAAWITRFLRKEEELDGRKHMKRFAGSDDELRTLATWLAGLR